MDFDVKNSSFNACLVRLLEISVYMADEEQARDNLGKRNPFFWSEEEPKLQKETDAILRELCRRRDLLI